MIISVPSQVLIAFGAVFAALLAGFFSFVNLVSAKENKVSEFRLNWIDGLRNEVAEFSAAIQEMIQIERIRKSIEISRGFSSKSEEERELEWLSVSTSCYSAAESALSKIQLRLNHHRLEDSKKSPEKLLMDKVNAARAAVRSNQLKEASEEAEKVRSAAAPLLKNTWNDVKNGEGAYQKFRKLSEHLLLVVFGALAILSTFVLMLTFIGKAGVV